MRTMPRLFFALKPRPDEAAAMTAAAAPLLQALGGKPLLPDDLHLTLCFLGAVHEEQLAGLIRDTSERVPPRHIRLELDQLEYWSTARLVCLVPGPKRNAPAAVAELAAMLQGLAPAGDTKPFRPHVTLVRSVPGPAAAGRPWPLPLPAPLTLTTDGFALMRSTGGAAGSRYAVAHAWHCAMHGPG